MCELLHTSKRCYTSVTTNVNDSNRAFAYSRLVTNKHGGSATEAHELDPKWRVPQAMIGRRLSQEEALLAKLE